MKIKKITAFVVACVVLFFGVWACSDYAAQKKFIPKSDKLISKKASYFSALDSVRAWIQTSQQFYLSHLTTNEVETFLNSISIDDLDRVSTFYSNDLVQSLSTNDYYKFAASIVGGDSIVFVPDDNSTPFSISSAYGAGSSAVFAKTVLYNNKKNHGPGCKPKDGWVCVIRSGDDPVIID